MSDTPNYGLPNGLNSSDHISATETSRLHNIIDSQIPGILSIFSSGIIPNEDDDNSLLVTDAGGLNVDIDAGRAIIPSSAGYLVFAKNDSSYYLEDLPDDTTCYIYAQTQSIGGSTPLTTVENTAPPLFISSESNPLAYSVLLATIVTENGAIVSITQADPLPFAQISALVAAVGLPYSNGATISARLTALETAVTALQNIIGAPSSGNTLDTLPVSSSDSTNAKDYVDAKDAAQDTVIANNYSALETAIATGGTSTVQTGFEQLAEELASQDIGVTEINPRWALRSTASRAVIDVWGDGTDGSPEDLVEGTATIDHDAGTIGP